jgi:hypothetical protein
MWINTHIKFVKRVDFESKKEKKTAVFSLKGDVSQSPQGFL